MSTTSFVGRDSRARLGEEYYEKGQVKVIGYFKNGRRDGTFERYAENGDLEEQVTYEKGRKI